MNDEEVVRAILAGIAMHGLINAGYKLDSIPRASVSLADNLLDVLEADDPLDSLGVAALTVPRRKNI